MRRWCVVFPWIVAGGSAGFPKPPLVAEHLVFGAEWYVRPCGLGCFGLPRIGCGLFSGDSVAGVGDSAESLLCGCLIVCVDLPDGCRQTRQPGQPVGHRVTPYLLALLSSARRFGCVLCRRL